MRKKLITSYLTTQQWVQALLALVLAVAMDVSVKLAQEGRVIELLEVCRQMFNTARANN